MKFRGSFRLRRLRNRNCPKRPTFEPLETRHLLSASAPVDVWSASAYGDTIDAAIEQPYVPGEVIVATVRDVNAESMVDFAEILQGLNLSTKSSSSVLELARGDQVLELAILDLDAGSGVDVRNLAKNLTADDQVLWATPNYIYEGPDPREFVPNDPSYGSQYHHPLMDNNLAWDITLGDSSVIVAVTDDGVDIDHPDLAANIWVNAGEIPGNGVDDDLNGFIDDINGWDFSSNDNNPNPINSDDDHGTHVAGIAAGVTNNGAGISGTAGGATIMPIRFFGSGSWTSSVVANSFAYATDNGAHIVNTSYNINGWVNDPTVTAAFQYMHDNDVLHFNSAGNGGELNPVRQAFHQTLLVANTTSGDTRSGSSNYGTGIDVAAPGSSILSTIVNGGYGAKSGTSMAAPNAAGVAALIWSANPSWTRDQVAAALLWGAENIDAQNPSFVGLLGAGRVNSHLALTESIPAPQVENFAPPLAGAPDQLVVTFDQLMDPSSVNNTSHYEVIGAGNDDVFGTADDTSYGLTPDLTYMVGTNDVPFTVNSSLSLGRHRLIIESGGLTNPFGTPLDGDGNGAGGDDFVQEFTVVNPVQITTPTSLPAAFLGQAYSYSFQATDGLLPYTWQITTDYSESDASPGSTGGGVAKGWKADDDSWLLNLPFAFPYYGINETAVYVGSNGFLDFDGPSSDYSNTTSELAERRRIAPLWDDLVTTNGDIYVDTSTAGEVTIRWDAVTYAASIPVDFAVTLDDEGGIRFDYGAAHAGLTPTIGVSGDTAGGYTLSSRDGDSSIPANVATAFAPPSSIDGFSLNPVTGELSGTPTSTGLFTIGVEVSDGQTPANIDSGIFTLEVLSVPPGIVAARHIFYNDSLADGNDPLANAADDGAIALDKTALLPGETATAANFTSYSRGVNGIMIDVANPAGTPTAADFLFNAGTSGDPNTWAAAPAPQSITVRPGEGGGGSDRVTIIWTDGALANTWLQVTVKATAATGLPADDVFYFGNVVGDTDGDADVDTNDLTTAIINFTGAGGSGKTFADGDTDADGDVDTGDLTTRIINYSGAGNPIIELLTAPALSLPLEAASVDTTRINGSTLDSLQGLTELLETINTGESGGQEDGLMENEGVAYRVLAI